MSDVMGKDVREIKWRVEGIEKSVDLLVRANKEKIIKDLTEFFGRSNNRVSVFLSIDGEKTVSQITKDLGMKKPNVSARITELQNEGLVKIRKITRQGYIYEKTEKVAVLNLEKNLKKKFGFREGTRATAQAVETGEKSEQ